MAKRKNWETTEGRILSSKAVRIGRRSRAHINYEFVVSGKRYRSWTIEPSETGNVKSVNDSGRLVGLHPPDSKVKVYFDANNPEDSLLYRDFSVGMWVNVISLLAFTGGPSDWFGVPGLTAEKSPSKAGSCETVLRNPAYLASIFSEYFY